MHDKPEHADAEPFGDRHGRAGLGLRDKDRLGTDIGQVKIQLVGAIGGIERRRRGCRRHSDKGGGHLRPVRQHDRHPVAPADAERVQPLGRGCDQAAQPAMAERRLVGRQDRRCVVRAGGETMGKVF
ncbi:hypothetical protein ACVILI_001074 [Mesorhizobium sp. USDA 4775]